MCVLSTNLKNLREKKAPCEKLCTATRGSPSFGSHLLALLLVALLQPEFAEHAIERVAAHQRSHRLHLRRRLVQLAPQPLLIQRNANQLSNALNETE